MNRVVLVDDHDLIRQGLRRAFERAGDFEVVGEAGSIAEARATIRSSHPDVCVVDVRLPDGNGLTLVNQLRQDHPTLGIVVLTMYAGDEQLFDALDAGASAFIAKNAPAREVVAAARNAAQEPRSFAGSGAAEALKRRMAPVGPQLSARENEILQLLARGLGVTAISQRLALSDATTKTHIARIYDTLGAANRAEAVMAAVKAGLVEAAGSDRSSHGGGSGVSPSPTGEAPNG